MRIAFGFVFVLAACGGASTSATESTSAAEQTPRYPCTIGERTLQVPVPRGFALAAGGDACMLVDERSDNTFVSIAAAGPAWQEGELRDLLRASGLLGDQPRFTGRAEGTLLGEHADVERFVADMPEIGRRAGAAMRSTAFVVLIFAADPSSARELETLTRTLGE